MGHANACPVNKVEKMSYKGTVKGNVIELDETLPYIEGTRIEITVTRDSNPRKGSPKAILKLAGTLTYEESEAIIKATQECRHIDLKLWK
jgi:hypothetical protein